MASPPCKWSLNSAAAATTSKTSQSFYSFRFSQPKRERFTASHSNFYPPPSKVNSVRGRKRLTQLKAVHKDEESDAVPVDSLVSLNRKKRRRSLSLKGFFEKKSLWRRIWFASKKVRSIMLLNVVTLVYASNIPVVKEVEAIMDPSTFNVVRFAVSAIPFMPFVLQARDDAHTRNAGIELGFWVSLGYLMQALGLLTSDAGRASFISMFTVVVVPILDGMLGAIIPATIWFGALMSIVGVAMLESSGSPPSIGDLLNFLSAVFFGVHMLRTEHISRSTKSKNFLPLLGYEVCVIAFFSIIWYFVGGWFNGIESLDPSHWTWATVSQWMATFPWIPALYTGIFSTGLCLWIEMVAMRDVSATETAIIYGLEPVWGAGFAWFLLGERWGTIGWIGAALILVGSITVQIVGSSPTKDEEEEKNEFDLSLPPAVSRNGLSASPVTVRTAKDVPNLQKK